jgi:S-DNA-T family DNA segregation ATPase FtsK/SpoIIIE
LESTLLSFGVKAKVVHVQTGPTVTRFEVQPEAGVKVSRFISLADDLALNLAAPLVRIEAPIPGKAALGIEVPNSSISLVHLREVMETPGFINSVSPLTVGLGKDITGIPIIADLTKMPHLLIAGATGAGKSVCLNTIITSILYKAGPEQVRFMMIDPKVVELSVYNGISQLLMPVITDPRKAALALKNMVREMGRRYDLFAKLGIRDIGAYNEMANAEEDLEKMAYIVVVIDELADLMMVSPGEVEDSIARLAQMSRAAGIHLLVATQRPSVDVLTGIIKANITSRIAFTVSSQVDSRTILDMSGAEKLLGRGDMLYYPVGVVKPFRVQGAYISEIEVKRVTDFIREQGILNDEETFTLLDQIEEDKHDTEDKLFPEAVDLVVRTGQASISLLQRRFRIGYTRAARLIDDLERKGIVGPFEGSKPREVLVTEDEVSRITEEFLNKE